MPFSSEAAFLVALHNDMPHYRALFFASTGNILAIIVNYILGYWLYDKTKTKLKQSKIGRKSLYAGYRYGYFAMLFSWLPIIGDPLTIVAGLLRLNFLAFIVLAGFLRIFRYYLLFYI